jgi:cytochrome c oxidase assembly factor CtaG
MTSISLNSLPRLLTLAALLWLCAPATLLAHGGSHHYDDDAPTTSASRADADDLPHNVHDLWRTWGLEPLSIAGLALSAWLYARGLRRLWRDAGVGRGVRRWEATCYAVGWFALFVALVSPLHPWGAVLFSAHMTQHEVLMLVAAPLLVLGQPLVVFLKALPPRAAASLARTSNTPAWQRVWQFLSNAFVAWLIHAIILWVWHIPALFQATLTSDAVHALQHTSFLASALLFWWAVFDHRRAAMGYGAALLFLFTTALHSGLLGILLTFARSVWYPAYDATTASWGLSPLEDQQLGGLIMWIPAGVVYIVAACAIAAAWLRQSERRATDREARAPLGTAASADPEGEAPSEPPVTTGGVALATRSPSPASATPTPPQPETLPAAP